MEKFQWILQLLHPYTFIYDAGQPPSHETFQILTFIPTSTFREMSSWLQSSDMNLFSKIKVFSIGILWKQQKVAES